MNCLVVAEHRNDELSNTALELISAARDLGSVTVALIGDAAPSVIEAVDVAGVAEILLIQAEVEELDPDAHRTVVSELLKQRQPDVTLVAATPHGLAWAAAVAVENKLSFAGDVHGVTIEDDSIVATRSFYGGKVEANIDFPGRRGVLLVLRPAVWPPASGPAGGAQRVPVSIEIPPSRIRRLGISQDQATGIDITKADLILAIGRGIGERENLDLFEELARKIGATLAVTRPLVDAGWAPPDRQVGQSGKTVKPNLYLAFGISGASQHLAGMRSSEMIVAVNNDPNATIFAVADYAAVLDAVALAQELEKLY